MREDWATSGGVDLHLDLGAGCGRRAALERALRDAIRSGRLAAGARLPSTRSLAAELRLARGTVSAAYDQLVAEGYLSARPAPARWSPPGRRRRPYPRRRRYRRPRRPGTTCARAART